MKKSLVNGLKKALLAVSVMAAVAAARGVGKRTLDNIRDCVEQLFRKDDEANE